MRRPRTLATPGAKPIGFPEEIRNTFRGSFRAGAQPFHGGDRSRFTRGVLPLHSDTTVP
jgi:hypothetical protein